MEFCNECGWKIEGKGDKNHLCHYCGDWSNVRCSSCDRSIDCHELSPSGEIVPYKGNNF